jgi:hypothetical protein
LNTTESVHDRPGARDAVQLFVVIAKSPVVDVVSAPVACELLVPLLAVQVMGAEVWPTTVSAAVALPQLTVRPGRLRAVPTMVWGVDDTVPSVAVMVAEAFPARVGEKVTTT